MAQIEKIVGEPDGDCYFVGHSLGCVAILCYLEMLKDTQCVGGAVLVAGFTNDLGNPELGPFFTMPFDWARIKERCKKFVVLHSNDDPYVSLKQGEILKTEIGAELIVQPGMKHFSGDDGITKLPVVLQCLLKMR